MLEANEGRSMTEEEWLTSTDSPAMLDFLSGSENRKLRLFACACCRRVWDLLSDKRSRVAVRKLEEFADNMEDSRLRRDAYNIANAAFRDIRDSWQNANWSAACAVVCAAYPTVPLNLYGNLETALEISEKLDRQAMRQMEANILRHLIPNPFRPVSLAPAWFTSDVLALARGIYDDRAFDRMPILADALQDAGCTNDDVLNHCRDAQQVHVRGCWVVDLLLEKVV
jgi:hypothetical protein